MLQADIDTLKAKKSIIECIRETISQEQPVSVLKRKSRRRIIGSTEPPQVEVTLLEQDYEQLTQQARSVAWIEQKISELQRIGDRLWHQLNQKEMLKAAIQRAEAAEIQCRRLEQQLSQARTQAEYDLDDGADREIDPLTWEDREL
jgi:multidrug efflux pump subunit AcrB